MRSSGLLLLVALAGCGSAGKAPCVRIESGVVCGARMKAINGDDYISFYGIPYAKPPVKEMRFAEPQKPVPFKGVYNATKPGPVCPQLRNELGGLVPPSSYSEDCLRVNVYTPATSSLNSKRCQCKPLLPVYVFIHGGSFTSGTGNPDIYGPEYLLSKGIVVVTINYRLASIGFLSLRSKYIPGNAGLRDALFALKWVQRNIKKFGGDPTEITLGGHSAGSAIAHLIALSPASIDLGLFKRTMYQSGNAISNLFTTSPSYAKFISELFLEGMGISSHEPAKSIHRKLIEAPIVKILQANVYVITKSTLPLTFSPVVEISQAGFTTIIPKHPEYLLRDGIDKNYTTLLGFTNNECYGFKEAFLSMKTLEKLSEFQILTVPRSILFESNILTIHVLMNKISNEYFNNNSPTMEQFLDLCTDSFYKATALRVVEKRLAAGAEPSFIYEFSYPGESSIMKGLTKTDWPGAGHSEDITYFFRVNLILGPADHDELDKSDPDSRMRNWMTTFVANYVKTGNPAANPEAWPPSTNRLDIQEIAEPMKYDYRPATPYMIDKKNFFDSLIRIGRMEYFG